VSALEGFEAIGKLLEGIDPEALVRLAVVRKWMAEHDVDFLTAVAMFDDVEPPELLKSLWDVAAGLMQLATFHAERGTIEVESQVSAFSGEPKVLIRFAGELGEFAEGLSPLAARHHAHGVLEAAEAAEHDAAFHAHVRNQGGDYEEAAAAIASIRQFRDRYREAQGDAGTRRFRPPDG
jgi:hypothetical protein